MFKGLFSKMNKNKELTEEQKIVRIKDLKEELSARINAGGDWQEVHTKLIRELYGLDTIFVALSREKYDANTHLSEPLISTKDFNGAPTIYVFSDINIATEWMKQYRHITEDMRYAFIGALKKDSFDYCALYQIAARFGTQMIMLDEGARYVGITMKEFLDTNNIDINDIRVPIDKQKMESMMANNTRPELAFVPVPAIGLTS